MSKKEKNSKVLLVDGTMFCYRAFYAIRELSNSKGEPTNAIYGFVTMLQKLVDENAPEYLAIAFDTKAPTFRKKEFKDYKAQRKPMPDELSSQIQPIKTFCEALGYAMFELDGYEADDLLGTMACRAADEGHDVFIVTGDKDALQLVNDKIKIINPHKDNLVMDAAQVAKRYDGLGPEKVIDIMGLMGDASDNIPGIPGVGEKTAIKFIKQFGSVENLLENSKDIKSKRQKELVEENKESAKLSKRLVTIDCDVPMEVEWEQTQLKGPHVEELQELCRHYEFSNLIKQLIPERGQNEEKKRKYQIVDTAAGLEKLVAMLIKSKAFAFDTETTGVNPMEAALVGLSFSWKDYTAAYVPVSSDLHKGPGLPLKDVLKSLKKCLEDSKIKKYGQNMKYDWIVMMQNGIEVKGMVFDTMLANYLINPVRQGHNLDDLALEYLSVRKVPTHELLGSGKNQITMDLVSLETVGQYAAEDADCVFRLVPILKKQLKEQSLLNLFENVEVPLLFVLAKMEIAGVSLDTKFLKKLSTETTKELDQLTEEIYKLAGETFNINSTKQLSTILFEKLELPVIKKTKTGYSTDVGVLEKLSVDYELPRLLLQYREKAKLKSTYLDALPELINEKTGGVHTSYNQTVTVTGRLSSSDPNLQNIPIKTEAGRQVRKAFIPRSKDRVIVSADYSQVELRILAHFSEDENLMHAFQQDLDIHRFTASLLHDVEEESVTREMRNVAKVVNFSIIYGKTAFGLSQDLNISLAEAAVFIDNYFERYAGVKGYLEDQKQKAHEKGFLTTLLNRRAYFPEINSSNMQRRQFAERAAINAPIQGTAADLIKLAMISLQGKLEKLFPQCPMIMQVHDELVFDVEKKQVEALSELVKDEMENACELKVPLKVDLNVGPSWYKGS